MTGNSSMVTNATLENNINSNTMTSLCAIGLEGFHDLTNKTLNMLINVKYIDVASY